jgi:uncharacterized membrane protein YozB (DUF420 family)
MHEGFLGTAAPLTADIVLVLEIVMGLGLLLGAWLARTKRFRQHAWCQSAIVFLNLAVVASTMAPSFAAQVLPRIPARLAKPYFALATVHAALGSAAEAAALYIVLAAGTRLLPERLRLVRYKLWMRTVLVLWWLTLLLGFLTYARWYAPNFWSRMAGEGSTMGTLPVPRNP